jgi:hypothetical protein
LLILLSLTAIPAYVGGQTYNASLKSLPDRQGFAYSSDVNVRDDGINPHPSAATGVLHQITTAGAQYWYLTDPSIDFSQHIILTAILKINSSNYIANIGTGTREGYYLAVRGLQGLYTVGLAGAGFNINSVGTPDQALTPYRYQTGTGPFHTYRLDIVGLVASFSIDGQVRAENIPPQPRDYIALDVHFGGSAGSSRSDTELKSFCFGKSASSC